jgi:2'-5' RNA ligase
MRTFIGLPLSEDFKDALQSEVDEIRGFHRDFHWTQSENLHITLVFLGDIERPALDDVVEAVGVAASESEAIKVRAGKLLTFPQNRPAHVLALDFAQGGAPISALASRIKGLLYEAEKESSHHYNIERKRKFHPHITLARTGRAPITLFEREWNMTFDLDCTLDTVTVFKSDLRRDGPLYTPLAEIALGN